MAGEASRVGGSLARVFGWVVLVFGMIIALGLGAIAHALFPDGIAGMVVGAPIALASFVFGFLLLRGGAKLGERGSSAARQARVAAVQALAARAGGVVAPSDVATSLGIPAEEAQALLDSLAREDFENVVVDVDASGALVYRFHGASRQRVDPELANSPNREEWERLEAREREERTRAQR